MLFLVGACPVGSVLVLCADVPLCVMWFLDVYIMWGSVRGEALLGKLRGPEPEPCVSSTPGLQGACAGSLFGGPALSRVAYMNVVYFVIL